MIDVRTAGKRFGSVAVALVVCTQGAHAEAMEAMETMEAKTRALYRLLDVKPTAPRCIEPAIIAGMKLGMSLPEASTQLQIKPGEWQAPQAGGQHISRHISPHWQARYPGLSPQARAKLLPLYYSLVQPQPADWVYRCAQPECRGGLQQIRVSVGDQARITAVEVRATVSGPDSRRHRFEGVLFSARTDHALKCGDPLKHPHLDSIFCYYESAPEAERPALSAQITDSQLFVRYECAADQQLVAALQARLVELGR